jgi:hypothetical protein
MSDFSQTILCSIDANSHYMEEDIINVYRHDHIMVKALFLRHINQEHFYDMVHHQSRILNKLRGLLIGTGCCKAFAAKSKLAQG